MSSLSDKEYLRREMARRELARKSYRRYLYYVHGELWKRSRMSDYLANAVQKFVEEKTGNAYDILIIKTPPQHGKSMTITESFPSWYLGRFPRNRVILASYNDDTAKRFGRKNIEKVEQFGPALFGLDKGYIWTTTEFELSNGWGRVISRGVMSGITGRPTCSSSTTPSRTARRRTARPTAASCGPSGRTLSSPDLPLVRRSSSS